MKAFLFVVILCSAVGFGWAACQNFTDYKVTFHSKNFEYILKWDEAKKLPPGTVYNVQYKQYGEKKWTDKYECQNISETFCNLTYEMSQMINDIKDFKYNQYYGRVNALTKDCSSDWVMSKRINVQEYTTFGPPLLTYVSGINSIKFALHPPNIFTRNKDGHPLTIQDIFYDNPIEYNLSISSRISNRMLPVIKTNVGFEAPGLDPDTEYNGTVYMFIERGRPSESDTFLVRTLPDKSWIKLILGGAVVSLVLLAAVLFYVGYKYVQQRGTLPKSLDLRDFTPCQPMNITMGHNVISYIHGFSKPGLSKPLWPAPNIRLDLREVIKQPPSTLSQGNAYKSQVTESTFQTSIQSSDQTNLSPVSYLSQETQASMPDTNSKNSPSTYGVCVEGASSVRNNTYQPNQLIPCLLPENNRIQYRPQTESLPNSPSESNLDVRAKLMDTMTGPNSETRDVEFRFKNDPLIQQLMINPEKMPCTFHMSSLFPLLKEENTLASDVDLGNYKPQATFSLSLLSSVTVDNNLHTDHELDRGQFLLHSLIEGDLPSDDHLTEPVWLETLSQERVVPFQYRANDIQAQAGE